MKQIQLIPSYTHSADYCVRSILLPHIMFSSWFTAPYHAFTLIYSHTYIIT